MMVKLDLQTQKFGHKIEPLMNDALAKGLKGKVTEEKDIQQDTVPGKEYQLDLPKGAARLQIYTVAGWVMYGVVEGSKEEMRSKEADAFFGSFKLTGKAKEDGVKGGGLCGMGVGWTS